MCTLRIHTERNAWLIRSLDPEWRDGNDSLWGEGGDFACTGGGHGLRQGVWGDGGGVGWTDAARLVIVNTLHSPPLPPGRLKIVTVLHCIYFYIYTYIYFISFAWTVSITTCTPYLDTLFSSFFSRTYVCTLDTLRMHGRQSDGRIGSSALTAITKK